MLAFFMERGRRRQRVGSQCKGWSMGQTYPSFLSRIIYVRTTQFLICAFFMERERRRLRVGSQDTRQTSRNI